MSYQKNNQAITKASYMSASQTAGAIGFLAIIGCVCVSQKNKKNLNSRIIDQSARSPEKLYSIVY